MAKNNLMTHKNIIHKIIVVDFIINIVLFLLAIIYGYRVLFIVSNPSVSLVGACLILLFVTIVLLTHDAIYLYQHLKGDEGFGMGKIMAIASITSKVLVLLGSVLMVCFVGTSRFISAFDMFFNF